MIKAVFQINRKDRLLHTLSFVIIWKNINLDPHLTHCIKIYSMRIKYFHIKSETMKILNKI